jgi:hypothetical protein
MISKSMLKGVKTTRKIAPENKGHCLFANLILEVVSVLHFLRKDGNVTIIQCYSRLCVLIEA